MVVHAGNGKDQDERGFQFPGRFEITAVGESGAGLETRVPQLLQQAGIKVLHESVRHRHSRNGNYISVTVSFECPSREMYTAAHAVLRDDDAIKYTL